MPAANPNVASARQPAVPSAPPQVNGRPVADSDIAITGLKVPSDKLVYQVTVQTADVSSAGTDADIYLVVNGTLGSTGKLFLDNADDNFERNKTDYFYFILPNIGKPTAASFAFIPKGLGPDWMPKTFTINGTTFSWTGGWVSKQNWYALV